ncbi:MAG: c-type cytochrome biogenesis protein CcmI [Burkholderiaceae bacterium]
MSTLPEAMPVASIAAIRARLLALADAHARGDLDAEAYETGRREAERALSDAVLAAPIAVDDAPVVPTAARPSWKLVAALVCIVVIVAIGGYAFTGSPSLAGLGVPPAPVAAADGTAAPDGKEREIGLQQIAEMVDKLAVRLKDRPDDAEGWTMLARSYTVLARYKDALPAYQRATELEPKNADLLADYSDATAAANGGKASRESLALIDRALAIDPKQPKALALSGTNAFERGDYAGAVSQWQKIADALPPDSEFHRQVMANIDEARRRGNIAAPVANAAAPVARAAAGGPSVAAAPGPEALTGTVTLDPALAAQASPNDTVFVLARPESGRMPLAVFRATVKDLPLKFRLDDSMAMTPTMKISDMKQVIVAARISKSGNAITQPGDLAGEVGPVAPGTKEIAVVIRSVAGGK